MVNCDEPDTVRMYNMHAGDNASTVQDERLSFSTPRFQKCSRIRCEECETSTYHCMIMALILNTFNRELSCDEKQEHTAQWRRIRNTTTLLLGGITIARAVGRNSLDEQTLVAVRKFRAVCTAPGGTPQWYACVNLVCRKPLVFPSTLRPMHL